MMRVSHVPLGQAWMLIAVVLGLSTIQAAWAEPVDNLTTEERELIDALDVEKIEMFIADLWSFENRSAAARLLQQPKYTPKFPWPSAGFQIGAYRLLKPRDSSGGAARAAMRVLGNVTPVNLYEDNNDNIASIRIVVVPRIEDLLGVEEFRTGLASDFGLDERDLNQGYGLDRPIAMGKSSVVGLLTNLLLVVQVDGNTDHDVAYTVLVEMYRFFTAHKGSDVIVPSLANTRKKSLTLSREIFVKQSRIPLVDFVVFQALWGVLNKPESKRPKTNAEFAVIVTELLLQPDVASYPSDLHTRF